MPRRQPGPLLRVAPSEFQTNLLHYFFTSNNKSILQSGGSSETCDSHQRTRTGWSRQCGRRGVSAVYVAELARSQGRAGNLTLTRLGDPCRVTSNTRWCRPWRFTSLTTKPVLGADFLYQDYLPAPVTWQRRFILQFNLTSQRSHVRNKTTGSIQWCPPSIFPFNNVAGLRCHDSILLQHLTEGAFDAQRALQHPCVSRTQAPSSSKFRGLRHLPRFKRHQTLVHC